MRFPVKATSLEALNGAEIVIWTTTPWTMPGNRATAYGEDIKYGIYQVEEVVEESLAKVGARLVFADDLADEIAKEPITYVARMKFLLAFADTG